MKKLLTLVLLISVTYSVHSQRNKIFTREIIKLENPQAFERTIIATIKIAEFHFDFDSFKSHCYENCHYNHQKVELDTIFKKVEESLFNDTVNINPLFSTSRYFRAMTENYIFFVAIYSSQVKVYNVYSERRKTKIKTVQFKTRRKGRDDWMFNRQGGILGGTRYYFKWSRKVLFETVNMA